MLFRKPVLKLNLTKGIFFWGNYLFSWVHVFCQKTGFKTKPLRLNKSTGGFISSSKFRLFRRTGLKTKPPKGIFFGTFIYSSEFTLYQKTVLKLNLLDGIMFSRNLFLRLGLCFCQKNGFKNKPRRRNNFFAKYISPSEFRFSSGNRF